MNTPGLSDKPVYQKVNLVGKKIYPPLALAVGRLILRVRFHFLNSELLGVFFLCSHLFILPIPHPPQVVFYLFGKDSPGVLHLQITFSSLKLKYLTYANMQIRQIPQGNVFH